MFGALSWQRHRLFPLPVFVSIFVHAYADVNSCFLPCLHLRIDLIYISFLLSLRRLSTRMLLMYQGSSFWSPNWWLGMLLLCLLGSNSCWLCYTSGELGFYMLSSELMDFLCSKKIISGFYYLLHCHYKYKFVEIIEYSQAMLKI